jgi:uncharacterized protein (TIGR02246 family)
MKHAKLGAAGIALIILIVVSLILSALFCAFPWSMTIHRAAAQSAALAQRRDPGLMTLVYADDDSTEARKQIDAGNATFLQAWKYGSDELFASCFAEDGALLHHGRPPILGRDAIRAHMKEVFSRYRMTQGTIRTIDVFLLGTTAYETGTWKFAIGPIGKKAKMESGSYVEVWKLEGTKWKMWRDIGVHKG